jgi:hypothetical protein
MLTLGPTFVTLLEGLLTICNELDSFVVSVMLVAGKKSKLLVEFKNISLGFVEMIGLAPELKFALVATYVVPNVAFELLATFVMFVRKIEAPVTFENSKLIARVFRKPKR